MNSEFVHFYKQHRNDFISKGLRDFPLAEDEVKAAYRDTMEFFFNRYFQTARPVPDHAKTYTYSVGKYFLLRKLVELSDDSDEQMVIDRKGNTFSLDTEKIFWRKIVSAAFSKLLPDEQEILRSYYLNNKNVNEQLRVASLTELYMAIRASEKADKKDISLVHIREIDQFFEGTMSAKERDACEDRMVRDIEFRHEAKLFRDITDALAPDVPIELFSKMEEIDYEEDSENAAKKTFNSRSLLMYILATCIILLFLSIYFIQKYNSSDRVIQQIEIADPGISTPVSAEMKNALTSFTSADYPLAEHQFFKLLQKDSLNDTLNYYYGLSLYKERQWKKSEPYFQKVPMKSGFYARAVFQLALAAWRSGDGALAKELFKKSADTEVPPYRDKAIEALKRIE